jgi:S1-C subfamily serine protease
MPITPRLMLAAVLILCAPRIDATVQQTGTLRITVTIVDANQQARPVPRHALLISENPTTAAPERTVTALDGSAQITLRPGNYTVESEQPLIFQGKSYEWAQTIDVRAGQAAALELTAANAAIEGAAAGRPSSSSSSTSAPSSAASALLLDWQNSVVAIWSPTKLGAGFVIDARGLIATNQRLVGTATSVEVQVSPTVKVAARVLASDPDKNVAILWIDPAAVASSRPMRLGYARAGEPLAEKQRIFSIDSPASDEKSLVSGTVTRILTHTILADIRVDDESLGAPLFNAAGDVVAITSPEDDAPGDGSTGIRAVRIDDAPGVIAAAEKKIAQTDAPDPARLPIEGEPLFPDDPLKELAKARKGITGPYRVPAADFDVGLITPVLLYAGRQTAERTIGRERGRAARDEFEMQASRQSLQDFGNWSNYVRDDPPVLLVRATPKLVESFWKTVLRGAAQTQGVALPPIKHVKAGFSRMRLFCGDAEVTPIHPFKIEHRIGRADAVYEGLYVFDPAAIGPHCGTVKLTLFSDKAPEKGDTRVIDAKLLEQIWDDFAPFRAAPR